MHSNHEIWRQCPNCGNYNDLRTTSRCDCGAKVEFKNDLKNLTESRKKVKNIKSTFAKTRKMKKQILIISTFAVILSCQSKKEIRSEESNLISNQNNTEMPEKTPLEQLELEASRLRAGGSVKEVKLTDGKAEIFYVKDYAEYKKLQPQSSLTEDDLKGYWETGSAIEKALIDGSGRIMKNLDFVNQVRIELPYNGKVYSVDVKKEDLEKITGKSFEELKGNWNIFVDSFVYSASGRQKFFVIFGSIK